jgi:hypothetical protein
MCSFRYELEWFLSYAQTSAMSKLLAGSMPGAVEICTLYLLDPESHGGIYHASGPSFLWNSSIRERLVTIGLPDFGSSLFRSAVHYFGPERAGRPDAL